MNRKVLFFFFAPQVLFSLNFYPTGLQYMQSKKTSEKCSTALCSVLPILRWLSAPIPELVLLWCLLRTRRLSLGVSWSKCYIQSRCWDNCRGKNIMVDKNCRLHLLTTGEFIAVAAPVATDVSGSNSPNLALTIIWCCAGARVLTLAQVSRFLRCFGFFWSSLKKNAIHYIFMQ